MNFSCISSLLLFVLFSVSTLTYASFMQSDIEYDGQLSITLTHALENIPEPVYSHRGNVIIQSIRSGAVTITQNPVTLAEKNMIKSLRDVDGIYRLRSLVTTADGRKFSFLTFTKGCALYESQLSDILTVSLDHAGNPVAVSMTTNPGTCEGEIVAEKNLQEFNTTVFVRHMEQGPTPDTSAYIQKLEKEKEARDRGETKDNRSFFAKYWMYIVPVVIFVLLSSAASPDGAAAGGGR